LRVLFVGERILGPSKARLINGAHVVLYSKDPEADRAFFSDVLKFNSVDAGHGWLIFALPSAEAAFHDAEQNDRHELYFMCDDIIATLRDLEKMNVPVSEVSEQRWGSIARFTLPGGGSVGIYQPKHPRPR
jgi:catechol 2,3-dioxygenase-like lactoylglutathione lyase family enzyme